ncbi:MAG: Ribosomal large subunit pseudouridine synthase D [Parcubacteria group bacterium Gr01-1014_46]|nr:MAG: Ribosomal large subunit pseudouridine synthase D [Parcubacteria group bacterium Gr01-1014_46]
MNPEILYEDSEVLAVDKPAGLVVHSDGKTEEKTLVDWLLSKYPEIKDVGEPGKTSTGETVLRSGIVHRLDRETSGVMLVAKTEESFQNLKKQFQNHEIKKTYQAFVWGELKNDEGVIDRPISRSSKDFRMWTAQRGGRGIEREAITEYKVLQRKDGYSFVEVTPKTGRTHQIRVHFKAINYPLVGDALYGPDKENTLGFKRLALHSKEVTFSDTKGESHTVSASYPEDFEHAMALLQSV